MLRRIPSGGAALPRLLATATDPRIAQINQLLRDIETQIPTNIRSGYAADANSANFTFKNQLDIAAKGEDRVGLVTFVSPYYNWYVVQIAGLGQIGCALLRRDSETPWGAREIGAITPGTFVIVRIFENLANTKGVILGTIPSAHFEPQLVTHDWIQQGSTSGSTRDEFYARLIEKNNLFDFNNYCGFRPLDQTGTEKGFISPLGASIVVDDFQAKICIDETCGLFLNYIDGYARLAARQFDEQLPSGERQSRDDEGEVWGYTGGVVYPWESLGLPHPGIKFTVDNDPKIVQVRGGVANTDLALEHSAIKPFHRRQDWGGYLGQGGFRSLRIPPAITNRFGQAQANETSVFAEWVGLDGDYHLASARGIYIGKRPSLPSPINIRIPEDPAGDDSHTGYKASGIFGSGEEHKIQQHEAKTPTEAAALILDRIAFAVGWKGTHPFYYHKKDFYTPADGTTETAGQISLDFSALQTGGAVNPGLPKFVRIDHRYGNVAYYQNESFLALLPDGGVVSADGFGGDDIATAGHRRISVPGNLVLHAGGTLALVADRIILKSRSGAEITAAEGSIRQQAATDIQMLGGNSGRGGILLQSNGNSAHPHIFDEQNNGLIGDAAAMTGIILKSTAAPTVIYGGGIYLRTGCDVPSGEIVIDAAKGKERIRLISDEMIAYTGAGFTVYCGPKDTTSDIKVIHRFTRYDTIIDTNLNVGGSIHGYREGGLSIRGNIDATGDISCSGQMASKAGGQLLKVSDRYRETLDRLADTIQESREKVSKEAKKEYEQTVIKNFYETKQFGDEKTGIWLRFSFCDGFYRDDDFTMPEPRWVTLGRYGLASSAGNSWVETPVITAAGATYPWPGTTAKNSITFVETSGYAYYDPYTGYAKAPGIHYEQPLEQTTRTKPLLDGLRTSK